MPTTKAWGQVLGDTKKPETGPALKELPMEDNKQMMWAVRKHGIRERIIS